MDINNLTTWPVKKLKTLALSLHSSIYQTKCFSSHDLRDYEAVKAELEAREFEFQEGRTLSIMKG
jgi:hypothetical protein